LGNACYLSVHNLLSSHLLPKNLKMKIYETIILHVVLYRCEMWSLTLREARTLKVFENRVLKREYLDLKGRKWWETGEDYIIRSFLSCTFHQILLQQSSKEDEMGGACSVHGRDEKHVQILVRKPEWKRPHIKLMHRWKDNIRINLLETGWESVNWIGSGQGPMAGSWEHTNEPLGSTKGKKFLD